ncbi:MAG TPA: Nif3-like dinuclear metal center hexameric protein [Marmoricola sp.]|nr:Nif3-like dinuclear metal center hexameric protein [Marmoricola sp.]
MLLQDVLDRLEEWYPARFADSWDAVGLVCGDPTVDVRRILLAVDPVAPVAAEAVDWHADLLVCHHPLLLKAVHGVAATSPKGRVLHRLLTNGCALFTAHTNADAPSGGVSDALAEALGLVDVVALEPHPKPPLDKVVAFVPADAAEEVRAAITDAGAGHIGDYDACTFSTSGEGRFRPLEGANPTIGSVGNPETVAEVRIESVLPRHLRSRVLAALLAAHPYEEPAYDVYPLADLDDPDRGSGRIGRLADPLSLRELADRVAAVLPATAHGVRVSGDPDRQVARLALCGGAGDFLLDRARAAGADAYLTSDLRHHPASEFREHDGPALLDVAHWAAEWTWLPVLRRRLSDALGDTVEVRVSTINTDPWTFRVDA